jgi:hypothetical protein
MPYLAHYSASHATDILQGALPAGSADTLLLPHVAARGSAVAPEPETDPLSPDEQVRVFCKCHVSARAVLHSYPLPVQSCIAWGNR